MYLPRTAGFEKTQLRQQGGGSYTSMGVTQLVALHLDPVAAAVSESFPCPTTKNKPPFFLTGVCCLHMPVQLLSLGPLACWPLHDDCCSSLLSS